MVHVWLLPFLPLAGAPAAAPLLQVIQAAGGVELARSVVVPLLTRDAIHFLHASGTPEERHLWVTLGDGWTKSRFEQ